MEIALLSLAGALTVVAAACTALTAYLHRPDSILQLHSRITQLQESHRGLVREIEEIRTADLPHVLRAAETLVQDAEGMLESAETKRKRAAAQRSREPNGQGADPFDAALASGDRNVARAALEKRFGGL